MYDKLLKPQQSFWITLYLLPVPLPLCVPVSSQSVLIVCVCISCQTLCSPGAYVCSANHSGDQVLTYLHLVYVLTRHIIIFCQSFWRPGAYLFPVSLYADEVLTVSQWIFNGRVHLLSNETPTWCNTVQVLFLQSHSTCFRRQAPIIRSIKKLAWRPLVQVL